MKPGSLWVVGTGFLAAGQTTPEAIVCIERAEKLFHMVSDPVAWAWLKELNPTAESLHDCYAEGKSRHQSYAEMAERMLAPVRQGLNVCAAFYGHPGVFVTPSHAAIRQARREGHVAQMLPGISAEDCLIADLGIDPAQYGCQSFEASYFLTRNVRFDVHTSLILWQIGAVGVTSYSRNSLWSQEGVEILEEFLLEHYPADHQVTVYQAPQLPVLAPIIQPVPLAGLSQAKISVASTLYVPSIGQPSLNQKMLERLGMPRPS
ncbi:MAG TPA: SAM-dependent methyltransferase [Thermoanaerobaculia bacterium]|nr:SAM-dependent methyltransferase [Thermoanaerobaculia bacterium]